MFHLAGLSSKLQVCVGTHLKCLWVFLPSIQVNTLSMFSRVQYDSSALIRQAGTPSKYLHSSSVRMELATDRRKLKSLNICLMLLLIKMTAIGLWQSQPERYGGCDNSGQFKLLPPPPRCIQTHPHGLQLSALHYGTGALMRICVLSSVYQPWYVFSVRLLGAH